MVTITDMPRSAMLILDYRALAKAEMTAMAAVAVLEALAD